MSNPIQLENREAGTRDWLITKVAPVAARSEDDRYQRQRAIEGYVSSTSVRAGDVLTAFVSTDPPDRYRVDVYRMGYYGGAGGRLLAELGPFQGRPQAEPVEREQQRTECGAGAARGRIFPGARERREHASPDCVAVTCVEEQRQASCQFAMQLHELAKGSKIRRRSGNSLRNDLGQHELDSDRGVHRLVAFCHDIVD